MEDCPESQGKKVFAAPGNAGTAAIAENLNSHPTDIEGLGKAAKEKGVDLVVVGPEAREYLREQRLPMRGDIKEVE